MVVIILQVWCGGHLFGIEVFRQTVQIQDWNLLLGRSLLERDSFRGMILWEYSGKTGGPRNGKIGEVISGGLETQWGLVGPIVRNGLYQIAMNPLRYSATSDELDDPMGFVFDIDIERAGHFGIVVHPLMDLVQGGVYWNAKDERVWFGGIDFEVGWDEEAGFSFPAPIGNGHSAGIRRLLSLEVGMMHAVYPPDTIDGWFADRTLFLGGMIKNVGAHLAVKLDEWKIDGYGIVSFGTRIRTAPVFLVRLGYRRSEGSIQLLGGWSERGYHSIQRRQLHKNWTFSGGGSLLIHRITSIPFDMTIDGAAKLEADYAPINRLGRITADRPYMLRMGGGVDFSMPFQKGEIGAEAAVDFERRWIEVWDAVTRAQIDIEAAVEFSIFFPLLSFTADIEYRGRFFADAVSPAEHRIVPAIKAAIFLPSISLFPTVENKLILKAGATITVGDVPAIKMGGTVELVCGIFRVRQNVKIDRDIRLNEPLSFSVEDYLYFETTIEIKLPL